VHIVKIYAAILAMVWSGFDCWSGCLGTVDVLVHAREIALYALNAL